MHRMRTNGPYLPIGKDGKKKQVYLVTFVDDATRFILHGQFYPTLDQVIVEDAFRQAILKYGIPEKVTLITAASTEPNG